MSWGILWVGKMDVFHFFIFGREKNLIFILYTMNWKQWRAEWKQCDLQQCLVVQNNCVLGIIDHFGGWVESCLDSDWKKKWMKKESIFCVERNQHLLES